MLYLLKGFMGGTLRLVFIALFTASIAACGGSDSPSGGSGGGGNGGGGNGGGNGGGGGGGGTDVPSAEVTPDDSLSPRQAITVTFSESMDQESLSLGGSLGGQAQSEWADEGVTLTLSPENYWTPGSQTLTIDGSSGSGEALETVELSYDVAAPFASSQEASVVIGQQDFSGGQSRQGGDVADANTLDEPMGAVAYDEENGYLFASDSGDSRVLAYDGIPEENNANALFVIGQPTFSSSSGRTAVDGMTLPQAVTTAGGQLIVTDTYSNRVLIYEGIPQSGPAEAAVVLGQDDMDSAESGCSATRFSSHLHGHFVTPQGRLLVGDASNNRVLIWNEIPSENAHEPDLVLGQSGFDTCAANDDDQNGARDVDDIPSARTLSHPTNMWSDDERLFVADQENNRVLVWNTFPTENFAEADLVLGQGAMNTNAINDDDQDGVQDETASARTLNYPWDVRVSAGQLFVTDMENNRVLIWNEVPSESFAAADVVIGQTDFESTLENAGNEAPTAGSLNRPAGVQLVNGQLFITDWENSRILIYDVQE